MSLRVRFDGVCKHFGPVQVLHGVSFELEPGRVYAFRIPLGHIRHTLRAGSRLQVDIVSSNFPRRARNTNSGNPVLARDGDDDIRVGR